jgi:hypothetical protein
MIAVPIHDRNSRSLARFSFPIPFWALSIGFLRVARHSDGNPFLIRASRPAILVL